TLNTVRHLGMKNALTLIMAALGCYGPVVDTAAATNPPGRAPAGEVVRAEEVLFMDDLRDAKEGKLSTQWKLLNGVGTVKRIGSEGVLALTEGAYAQIQPRVPHPLGDSFTLELEFYATAGGSEVASVFLETKADEEIQVNFGREVWIGNVEGDARAPYPPALEPEAPQFGNRWHHATLTYRAGKLACA